MAAKISKEYQEKAINLMSLNITDDTMFILIPSENDDQIYHRVDLTEETMQSKKCYCKGFARWKHCKHCTIVDTAFAGYAGYVAPVEVVEPVAKITEIEAGQWYIVNSNTQVWRNEDGQWMAVGPTENAVKLVEAHIASQKQDEMPAQQPVVVSPVIAKVEPAYTMPAEKLAKLTAASQGQAVVVEEPAAVEAPKDNVVDIAERGSLNGAQHAASFWAMLPSRKTA